MKFFRDGIETTDSLTDYFGHGIHCPVGPNGYFQDKCISGTCSEEQCSTNVVKYSLDSFGIPDKVDYHQFVK